MEGHQPAGLEERGSLTTLEKSLEEAGGPGESVAPRETLAASVRTVASQVVGSSPQISDIFDDKAEEVFTLTHVGSEEEKCGLCPRCSGNQGMESHGGDGKP